MTLEDRPLGALNGSDGIQLTIEETLMMRAVWSTAERVDWAVYEQLRLRLLAWPSLVPSEEDMRMNCLRLNRNAPDVGLRCQDADANHLSPLSQMPEA